MEISIYEGRRIGKSESDRSKQYSPSRARLLRYVPLVEDHLTKLFKKFDATVRVSVDDDINIFRVKLIPAKWPVETVGYEKYRNKRFTLETDDNWNWNLYYTFYYEPSFVLEHDVVIDSENTKSERGDSTSEHDNHSKLAEEKKKKYNFVLEFIRYSCRISTGNSYYSSRYSNELRNSGERKNSYTSMNRQTDQSDREERDYRREKNSSDDDERESSKQSEKKRKRHRERSVSYSSSESRDNSDSELDEKNEQRKRSRSKERRNLKRRHNNDDDDSDESESDIKDRSSTKKQRRNILERVHDVKDERSFRSHESSDYKRK